MLSNLRSPRFALLLVALVCCTQLIVGHEQDEQNAASTPPMVVPLDARLENRDDLRRFTASDRKLNRLLVDCNSKAIVRAIRRPNIVSADAAKLRLCLTLLDAITRGERILYEQAGDRLLAGDSDKLEGVIVVDE
ncbi:hypothetical protein M3Y99_00153400 [Aphelenchoides fujianensis]|nr:hypothetical protein M3Y99_00153400 [Aphelenchoides fujianensis]